MSLTQYEIILTVFAGTFLLLLLASFGIIFTVIHKKKQQLNKEEKLLLKSQFSQALLQTQLEIQEQTLKTISQEIHDNIGQVLSLAKLNLNTLPVNEEGEAKLHNTRKLVSKAINDLRDLTRSMYGDKVTELGLRNAIDSELKILNNTGQFVAVLHVIGYEYKLPQKEEMVLFRMVQESMNNAIKHSKAKDITITLDYQPYLFTITVADNGVGFDPQTLSAAETGLGLKSMQNRAKLIGGTCTINTAPGKGTAIIIKLDNQNKKELVR